MAVGFPSKVNFATGDVLSATNVNDISGTLNLVEGTQYSGGKNRVLNSAMQVWQRGTTGAGGTSASTGFVADRWQGNRAAAAAGLTMSRQVTGDTTNLPNIQYCARVQRDSANTGVGRIYFGQGMETINSIPLVGKTVAFSFYARKGSNYSSASDALSFTVTTGTGTDQNFMYTGYTGSADAISSTATLTTTWQRFTATGTIATTATEIGFQFYYTPVGTAGTNDYFEVTGVQLEASSVASAFSTNGGTYQAELAACQRYYFRAGGDNLYQYFATSALAVTTSSAVCAILPPSTMRVAPTALDYSTLATYDVGAGQILSVTNLTLNYASKSITSVTATTAASLTVYRPLFLIANNSTSAYLGLSAEL